jgi:hypothetical protein
MAIDVLWGPQWRVFAMVRFFTLSLFFSLLLLPSIVFAEETICADAFLTGVHENVVVPAGTVCESSAQIDGNVKVLGAFIAHPASRIHGDVDAEPGHSFVRLLGPDVVVSGNVQLKGGAGPDTSGYLAGTVVGGNFQAEENLNLLVAEGGTIGGNLVVVKNSGGSEISGNVIVGNLQCKENEPAPTGGGNTAGGKKDDQCAEL